MKLVSAISIPLEDRLLLGDERVVGAHEILRLHADCLRLGFCFDRSLDRHRPFHLELILGHAVREGRTVRQIGGIRSEEHTSELQSLMRISYAVFCLKKKKKSKTRHHIKDL